jgi:predicted transcriptional regulator
MSKTSAASMLLHATAQIVVAYSSRNELTSDGLRQLIGIVYNTLAGITQFEAEEVNAKRRLGLPLPHLVFPGYIVCLEDGRKLKMLRRHLFVSYNLTPEQYRQKWGLPADYPMVAPDYIALRSALAVKHGLGRNRALSHRRASAVHHG